MNRLKKMLTASILTMTVLSMTFVVSPVQAATMDGDLVRTNVKSPTGGYAVYYIKSGKRYLFANEQTYRTWYVNSQGKSNFTPVKVITESEMFSYAWGGNVLYRPGTLLMTFDDGIKYAVEPKGVIRRIADDVAASLYGASWATMVVVNHPSLRSNYTESSSNVVAGTYPAGTILNQQGTSDLYYFDGTNYRKFSDEAALVANGFSTRYVVTTAMAVVATGTAIAGLESALNDTTQGGAGSSTGVISGTGTGLTVALASNTPAASTYVRQSATIAQSVAPFVTANFTASSDGDVVVSTVKFTRSGISSDTDLGNLYLYDGDTRIAEHTSFNNKVVTFTNSAGLFTILRGTTKAITLKADIAGGTTSVSGITMGINAATDVTAGSATVSGSFPVTGNSMAVGTVSDMGYLNIATVSSANYPSTIDPGVTGYEIFRMNVTANSQQMNLERLKFTLVGTIATTDLANFVLKDTAGTQIGSTLASMNTSKELDFDASANPYKITSGQTKTLVVYADVLNGSARAFRFTVRKSADVVAKDNGYGVYVAPLYNSSAFTLIDAGSSYNTTINSGTVTSGTASDAPSGNIAAGATGVTVSKFTLKANGEDVKVNYIRVTPTAVEDFKNGKLLWDGSQVGSTDTVVATGSANAFTVNQVIPAGTTVTLTYQADTTNNRTSAALSGTILASLTVSTTGDATGQSSLSDVTITGVTGRTLTLSGGTMTAYKNGAFAEMATATPTGVRAGTNMKVGSFVIKAGSGEGSIVNQIVVGDDNGDTEEIFGANFQNLKLMHGTTQVGSTQGSLATTAGQDYTFSISPALTLAAGEEYAIDVYADSLSGGTGFGDSSVGAGARPGLEFVSVTGTGAVTSAATTFTNSDTPINLQALYIASGGNLTISLGTTPSAATLVMGSTENTIGVFTFDAGTSPEDILISRIKLYGTSGEAGLSNIKFYDGSTLLGTVSAFQSSYAQLDLTGIGWSIPKGTAKTLTIKADVNTYPNATSAGTVYVKLGQSSTADVIAVGKDTGSAIAETYSTGSTAPTASTMTLAKTKLTVSALAGTSGKSNAQTIGVFRFANSSNVAGQAAKLIDLAVNISTSGTWTTLATTASIKVYRDSVINGNLLGVSATATAPANVALLGWTQNVVNSIGDNNTGGTYNNTLKDVSISSGSYVDIYVVADTTGAPSSGTLTVTIPATSGVVWEDGVSTGSSGFTTIDSLPVSAPMMTF